MADIRDRTLTLASCRFDWVFHGYDKMLEGKSTFSDIDAVAIVNDHALLIEHKFMSRGDEIPQIYDGQRKVYKHFLRDKNNTILFVAGDMEKSIPYYIEDLGTGESVDLRHLSDIQCRKYLKDMLFEWNKKVVTNGTD